MQTNSPCICSRKGLIAFIKNSFVKKLKCEIEKSRGTEYPLVCRTCNFDRIRKVRNRKKVLTFVEQVKNKHNSRKEQIKHQVSLALELRAIQSKIKKGLFHNGESLNPKTFTLLRVCRALGITLSELLEGLDNFPIAEEGNPDNLQLPL